MSKRALRRHYEQIWKKKKHPAAKCGNAKCLICHSDKVMKVKDRQELRQNEKDKTAHDTGK